ncbi:FUCL6-like protein, partial [Mya arenaria]
MTKWEIFVTNWMKGTRNVAIGKTASQSSNYRKNKWLAPTAIDGIVGNNSWFSGTCFHTTKEYQPWWRVDLQLDYYITSVVIHNRLDCCTNRAGNIKLTIGKSLNSMKQAGYLDGTSNVALGKTASQSSNYGNSYWLASTAVDGNVGNNKISSDSCFHTTKEYQPWWMVDLHQDYYITSVVIHNRLDNCDGRARNIKLTIGKRLDSMYQVGYQDGLLTTRTFTVDPPLVGRYVQLQLIGVMEFFHLCEVEVMAFPLVMWQGAYSLIGEMHNVEPSITEIYKKPGSYSNGSSWTAVGRFDNETRNGRYSALGVSRPLSSMTCSDAGVYSCDVGYINSSSIMVFHTGTIRKELKVQVTHSKITKRIFDVSNDEDGISSELTNSTPIVHVGQKLRLQCTANTGSFNTSVQIVWMKRSLANGGHLSPFFSDKHIIGEPKAFGICEFEKTDSIIYEVSQEDAERTPKNEFPVNTTVISGIIGGVCALVILGAAGILLKRKISNGYCHKADEKSDETIDTVPSARDSEIYTEIEFPVNRTVISGILGGVCSLVFLGAVGNLLKRKISNGCCPKVDEKSDETSRNPDAPVDTVPSARDSEIYTEIEFPVNRTVKSGILGGVCSLVFLGAVGNLLKRKISNGCCPKADEKSDETSRNPDAPVDTVPSARDLEIYTEIEETSDSQA